MAVLDILSQAVRVRINDINEMMQHIIKILFIVGTLIWQSCEMKEKSIDSDPEKVDKIIPLDSSLLTHAYVTGDFVPTERADFTEIHRNFADRDGLHLRREVYDAFVKMWKAAKSENVQLTIRSATRNFDYQKGIWERKWIGSTALSDGTNASDISDLSARAKKILLYSSMPGTSRHHWGTDIDLNNFNNSYFESGPGLIEYQWLQENAVKYGFFQPYTSKTEGRTGYEEEKWHWSYAPTADHLTKYYQDNLNDRVIGGFMGAETAKSINVVRNYVLGINTSGAAFSPSL